jgi:hypothetical protein
MDSWFPWRHFYWHPERQSSGRFLLVVAYTVILVQWHPARSKALPAERWFYKAKLKLGKVTGIKGPIRKF